MTSRYLFAALLGTLLIFSEVPASAQDPARHLKKLDLALRQAVESGAETERVIIRVKPGASASIREWLERHGDHVYAVHPAIDALSARVHGSDLVALERDQRVLSISTDAVVGSEAKPGSPTSSTSAGLLRRTLGLTGTTVCGAGIGVAVVDTGIEYTNDLKESSDLHDTNDALRIAAFYDYTKGGIAATPYDDSGHGSHVAGLIGGNGALSSGEYAGVAPCVRLIGFKVLDKSGAGSTSTVISAIEFAIANKARLGIDVINLSLGHPVYESAGTDPLVQVVERAVRAGIVVVASAGNSGRNKDTGAVGYGGISSPGNAPSAITVGDFRTDGTAIRSDDRIATYSSRGPTWYDGLAKPDLVAPGNRLVSNSSRGSYLYNNGSAEQKPRANYLTLSGTSMAAGVASGAVALVLEANRAANVSGAPPLTPNAVKAILQFTAFRMRDDLGTEYDYLTQGAGALNPAGAIELAAAINTSVPVGAAWTTGGVVPITTIETEVLPWAQNIVWGDNIVWGETFAYNQQAWALNIVWGDTADLSDNIVWGNWDGDNIVWGNNIVWGDNIVWSDNIVWGDNVVWGNNIVWADNIVWGDNLVGTSPDGTNVTWGVLSVSNIVWGNLSDPSIVSGNAKSATYLIVGDWKSK